MKTASGRERCTATTRAGTRCSNPAMPGSDRCWGHAQATVDRRARMHRALADNRRAGRQRAERLRLRYAPLVEMHSAATRLVRGWEMVLDTHAWLPYPAGSLRQDARDAWIRGGHLDR